MMEMSNMQKPGLEEYLNSVFMALSGQEESIQAICNAVRETKSGNGRIWMLGNGGSLAIAQHFAQDILKEHQIRAQCMNDGSVMTAFTNDIGFEWSLYLPLKTLLSPEDMIFAFSCSGKSKNYVPVFNNFKNKKIVVVGTDGGFMKEKADICVHAKSQDYKICEAAFGIVADLINIGLEE